MTLPQLRHRRPLKCSTYGDRDPEAKRIARRRISDCFKYGIKRLKIVYGSPENFAGILQQGRRTNSQLLQPRWQAAGNPEMFVPLTMIPI